MELRDQVVDKGGIALVRLLLKQHRVLAVCLVVCLAVCLSACPGFSIDPAALSTVLQHPNKVELGRPSLVSGAWH